VERQASRKRERDRGVEPHVQVDAGAAAEPCPNDHGNEGIERTKYDVSIAAL